MATFRSCGSVTRARVDLFAKALVVFANFFERRPVFRAIGLGSAVPTGSMPKAKRRSNSG